MYPFFMRGFTPAYTIANPTDYNMFNVNWNLTQETLKTNYSNLMVELLPRPQVPNWLLDPSFTMAQLAPWLKNVMAGGGVSYNGTPIGGTLNGSFGGGSIFGGGFNMGDNSWNWGQIFQNAQNGGASPSSSGSGQSAEQKKINNYKHIFVTIQNSNSTNLSSEIMDKYKHALNMPTDAEKVTELEKVLKELNPDNIRTAVMKDPEIAISLAKSGYPGYELDPTTQKSYYELITDVWAGFTGLASIAKGDKTSGNIIRVLSKWNDENEKSLLDYVADKVNNGAPGDYKNAINNFVTALRQEADKYSGSPKIKAKLEKLDKVNLTFSDIDSDNYKNEIVDALKDLDPVVNDLYAQIRIQQAADIDKQIKEKYGDLKSITSDGKGISSTKIQDETRNDLKKERIEGTYNADEIKAKSDEFVSEGGDDGDVPPGDSDDNGDNAGTVAQADIVKLVKEGKLCYPGDENGQVLNYNFYKIPGKNKEGDYFFFNNGKLFQIHGLVKPDGWVDFNDGFNSTRKLSELTTKDTEDPDCFTEVDINTLKPKETEKASGPKQTKAENSSNPSPAGIKQTTAPTEKKENKNLAEIKKTFEKKDGAKKLGQEAARIINEGSLNAKNDKKEYMINIIDVLKEQTIDTIIEFLKGYDKAWKGLSGSGFFEQLAIANAEDDGSGDIKFKDVKEILKKLKTKLNSKEFDKIYNLFYENGDKNKDDKIYSRKEAGGGLFLCNGYIDDIDEIIENELLED